MRSEEYDVKTIYYSVVARWQKEFRQHAKET